MKEELPFQPVVYLGLSRLIPTGENDDGIKQVKKSLPEEYQKELIDIYNQLTGLQISNINGQEINGIKKRLDFNTTIEGVDSNTISAGEDNLLIIILSLLSLKLYYELSNGNSTLLIDEIDATLHPSLQNKLLNLINEYSQKYNIQVFFTTHSLYLIEKSSELKKNIIYLTNYSSRVGLMESPDIYKIRLSLNQETRTSIFSRHIPIVSEDAEARWFIDKLLDYLSHRKKDFSKVRNYFKLVDISLGKDELKSLFKDPFFRETSLRSICILDGDVDKNGIHPNLNIMVLPGNDCPELIMFKYVEKLFKEEALDFWDNEDMHYYGFSSEQYRDTIRNDVQQQINNYDRDDAKKLLNNYLDFFTLVITQWLYDENNQNAIYKFLTELQRQFHKVASFHNINKYDWAFHKQKS